ncbi:MAG TPA: nucleoside hydrolase [Ktedonobacteraceae bacterium]|nr:nucleoside hydrolase [Ktedonobacteraceae bacterium]
MSQSPPAPTQAADQSRRAPFPVLIDTDIGDDIDDAFALALALRSPEIELHGVTTVFGDTRLRARLARHLLHIYGRDNIPVAAGESTPLLARHRPSGVPQAAILDPCEVLPISSYSGPKLIVQKAQAFPGQLTLICIGPLTNIADALRIDPHLYTAIRSIVMMGGTSGLPSPEWNVRSDARAAQVVLASGIPITLLGWNITRRCQLQPADIARLSDCETQQARLLSQLLAVWQRHRPRCQTAYPELHDPLTIAAICAPELLRFEEMAARVLVNAPPMLRGVMVPRLMGGPLVRAVVGIQANKAREWVMGRLLTEA